jgi:hypothetical protein
MNSRNLIAAALLPIGLLQMTGELTGNRILKGIGAAIVICPCPKVFCDINGLEPFASSFTITTQGAQRNSFKITPELYAKLQGPYNRRNVYGAAIAGAPLLPAPLRDCVLHHAFRPGGLLGQQLHVTEGARVTLTVRSNTRGRTDQWNFSCTP